WVGGPSSGRAGGHQGRHGEIGDADGTKRGAGGVVSAVASTIRISRAYFSSVATLSMPALAQASSLSPPGAPEMPMAPIVSLPTMIGSAPWAATKFVKKNWPALGFPFTAS